MKIECSISEETREAVGKLVAKRERRTGEKVTLSEMCSELVTTGAFRRLAANKWADAHAKPRKARKPAKAKAKRAAAPRKAPRAAAPRPPAAEPQPQAAPPTPEAVAAANPAPSPLD